MTAKERIIEIIGGDQVHHLWDYLTKNWWEPQFSVFQGVSYMMAYNGHTWYTFMDPSMPEDPEEMRYNMAMPLDNQDASVYEILLQLLAYMNA